MVKDAGVLRLRPPIRKRTGGLRSAWQQQVGTVRDWDQN